MSFSLDETESSGDTMTDSGDTPDSVAADSGDVIGDLAAGEHRLDAADREPAIDLVDNPSKGWRGETGQHPAACGEAAVRVHQMIAAGAHGARVMNSLTGCRAGLGTSFGGPSSAWCC